MSTWSSSSSSLSLWCGCVPTVGVVSRASFIWSTGITSLICTKFFVKLHSKLLKQPTHFRVKQSHFLSITEQVTQKREKNNVHLLYPSYPFVIELLSLLFSQDCRDNLQNQVSPLFHIFIWRQKWKVFIKKKKIAFSLIFFSIPVSAGNVNIRFSGLAGDFLQEKG